MHSWPTLLPSPPSLLSSSLSLRVMESNCQTWRICTRSMRMDIRSLQRPTSISMPLFSRCSKFLSAGQMRTKVLNVGMLFGPWSCQRYCVFWPPEESRQSPIKCPLFVRFKWNKRSKKWGMIYFIAHIGYSELLKKAKWWYKRKSRSCRIYRLAGENMARQLFI